MFASFEDDARRRALPLWRKALWPTFWVAYFLGIVALFISMVK